MVRTRAKINTINKIYERGLRALLNGPYSAFDGMLGKRNDASIYVKI